MMYVCCSEPGFRFPAGRTGDDGIEMIDASFFRGGGVEHRAGAENS